MKQRGHQRFVNGRYITINPGFVPKRETGDDEVVAALRESVKGLAYLGDSAGVISSGSLKPQKASPLKSFVVQVASGLGGRWTWRTGNEGGYYTGNSGVWKLQPGQTVSFRSMSASKFSKFNLSDVTFAVNYMALLDFKEAVLDGVTFKSGAVEDGGKVTPKHNGLLIKANMYQVSFERASLRGAVFEDVLFLEEMSFAGADLEGAIFSNCLTNCDIDFRGSNVTKEQVNTILSYPRSDSGGIIFDYVDFDEAVEIFGVDRDELCVLIWMDGLDVRTKKGERLSAGETFDPKKHVVPQWDFPTLSKMGSIPSVSLVDDS